MVVGGMEGLLLFLLQLVDMARWQGIYRYGGGDA